MNPQVFLSYSRRDSSFALELAKRLKQRNVPVWVDQWNIPTGAHWPREIENALRSCTHVLLILSANSVASKEVLNEMRYASDSGKIILPVICGPCEIPLRIQPLQYIDFTTQGFEVALEKVVKQFFTGIQPVASPTDTGPAFVMRSSSQQVHHPDPAPKRLFLSTTDRWIAGVFGGLAEYWGVNSIFLRIVFLIIGLLTSGFSLLIYPVLWWWMAQKH